MRIPQWNCIILFSLSSNHWGIRSTTFNTATSLRKKRDIFSRGRRQPKSKRSMTISIQSKSNSLSNHRGKWTLKSKKTIRLRARSHNSIPISYCPISILTDITATHLYLILCKHLLAHSNIAPIYIKSITSLDYLFIHPFVLMDLPLLWRNGFLEKIILYHQL